MRIRAFLIFFVADHQLSKLKLMEIIWNSTEFQYLYVKSPDQSSSDSWTLRFHFNGPPSSEWVNVKQNQNNFNLSKENLAKQQTLLGVMTDNDTNHPTDSARRWILANMVFGRGSSKIIAPPNILKKYLMAMYEEGLKEGVTYFETRKGVKDIDLDVNVTNEVMAEFQKLNTQFIGHKRIYHSKRKDTSFDIKSDLNAIETAMAKYPDHVLGYDIVGDEDAGNSLLYYMDDLLELIDERTEQSKIPLYLHSAETNWPDDLQTSDSNDLVASNQNTYESILLNSKRIGHGIGFFKHPYLLQLLKAKQTPIEICVVSNQILGYSADIRNHPGQHFYKMGIPIVINPDDPSFFGYDEVTVDWYEAYMAWGLNLGDLKHLAINSLNHSGMTQSEKVQAIEDKWRPMWDKYIEEKMSEACKINYAANAVEENRKISFIRLFPKEGAQIGSTKVHVFGRNFEVAICKMVRCKFDESLSPKAIYISNQHIICEAPNLGDNIYRNVNVSIALDGHNFIRSGLTFTYKFEPVAF